MHQPPFLPDNMMILAGDLSWRSPWLAGECLLQRRQAIECGGWQRAFLNRGERILELLRRCHADQDGAHRRMRDRKPRGGFGQALRQTPP